MNSLRTCILFLMLYLIFTQQITVGQFFSLLIYSFFIFGPLQELGNVINIYRETEASLRDLQKILDIAVEPKPANPVAVERSADARVRARQLHAPDGGGAGARRTSRSRSERGETVAFVGPVGRGQDHARQAARRPLPPAGRPHPLQRHAARHESTSTRCASASASSRRTRSCSPGSIRENLLLRAPRRDRRRVPRRAAARPRATACSRAPTRASTR